VTPERWTQIDALFDQALQLDPADRSSWLRQACDGDEPLRAAVARLLDQHERAIRDGFLALPETNHAPADATASWPQNQTVARPPGLLNDGAERPSAAADPTGRFVPRTAICAGSDSQPMTECERVLRSRLRELALIYLLIFGMTYLCGRFILSQAVKLPIGSSFSAEWMRVSALCMLVGLIALLSSPVPLSARQLRALELYMVACLAASIAFVQYRLMLLESLHDDPMMAQLTMKNVVLLISVLITTYAIYIPKGWRTAALMVVPLAILPFAILLALYVRHPEAMAWLGHGWRRSETARLFLFSFDAMLLLTLSVGSIYGASMMSGLRLQVAEARQLGQYRLSRLLGKGGMGEVYLAEHQLLKRECALKLIHPDDMADPNAQARFEREVQITATLSHPNIVEIYDYGRTENGTYYYVMEYLPGMSLAEMVRRHGPLPPGRVVYLVRQVCLALSEAHSRGLIHRDLKPSNILIARRGTLADVAKLLDFGLVLPAKARAPHLSAEGQIVGTPQYMSPEQAMGSKDLDERSDIYSLGGVAYYLLTGRPPFDEATAIETIIAHARDRVISPSKIRDGVPDDLEQIVLRCLAKDPADRFPDAESLERALSECGCAGDWDRDEAARWWRSAGRSPLAPVPVA
jgi:serine/threonine-protein kinase